MNCNSQWDAHSLPIAAHNTCLASDDDDDDGDDDDDVDDGDDNDGDDAEALPAHQ